MASKKKPFAVIDTETDPFKAGRLPEPFCAGFYDGEEYQSYWGENAIQYLCEDLADYDGFVYAHNGGKFDFHFMLDYAEPGKVRIINGRIAEMRIGKAILRDSFLILPVPLSAHQKTEIDYNKFEKECRESHRAEILDYLRDDCHDLWNFIDAFFQRFPRKLTLPSIAIDEIEKAGDKLERLNKNHDTAYRPFYYGGRVQCFESGTIEGDFTMIDINSAYPAVMRQSHPHGAQYTVRTTFPKTREKQLCSFYHFYGKSKGALPIRQKDGSITFQPWEGEFRATGHEVMAGLETGTLEIVSIISIYEPLFTRNFADFVDKFYAEKLAAEKAGDATGRLFAKLIMNSGYGKFAANPEKYKDYFIAEPGQRVPEYDLELTEFGAYWLWSKPIDTDSPAARYFDVATAASITGAVRAFMWRSILAVERPLYCDTDSILCEGIGDLHMGDALGEWSIEAAVTRAHIAGKKLYALETPDSKTGWKVASKGVKATPEQIIKAAQGHDVFVERDAPTYSAKSVPRFNNRIIRKTVEMPLKGE